MFRQRALARTRSGSIDRETAPGKERLSASFRGLKLPRVDLRVDSEPVERGLLDRFTRDSPPETERQFQTVDVAEIGIVHPVFNRFGLREYLPSQICDCRGVLIAILLTGGVGRWRRRVRDQRTRRDRGHRL